MALADRLPPAQGRPGSVMDQVVERLSDDDRAVLNEWLAAGESYARVAAALAAETGVKVSEGQVGKWARDNGLRRQ